jgi:hypothetical protein
MQGICVGIEIININERMICFISRKEVNNDDSALCYHELEEIESEKWTRNFNSVGDLAETHTRNLGYDIANICCLVQRNSLWDFERAN